MAWAQNLQSCRTHSEFLPIGWKRLADVSCPWVNPWTTWFPLSGNRLKNQRMSSTLCCCSEAGREVVKWRFSTSLRSLRNRSQRQLQSRLSCVSSKCDYFAPQRVTRRTAGNETLSRIQSLSQQTITLSLCGWFNKCLESYRCSSLMN